MPACRAAKPAWPTSRPSRNEPYGTVLLHRPAGILPAADLAPRLRSAGEKAARQAIEAGACAADLSSLHLLGLLADDDRLRIRSALPSLTVARSAIDDALLTRDHVRNLSAATYTASLAPDGTIDRTTITTTEQALLRTRAETLETITAYAHARRPASACRGRGRRHRHRPGKPASAVVRRHRPAAESPARGRRSVQPA